MSGGSWSGDACKAVMGIATGFVRDLPCFLVHKDHFEEDRRGLPEEVRMGLAGGD